MDIKEILVKYLDIKEILVKHCTVCFTSTYLWICAPSEDSDQPAHSHSLIRIFTERILDSQGCEVSSCGQRRHGLDCPGVQADLSLRLTHMSEGRFLMLPLKYQLFKCKVSYSNYRLQCSINFMLQFSV